MTETRATAPVFPPGRYGRRRAPRRVPRWLPVLLVGGVLLVGLLVAVRLYQQYGDPMYRVTGTTVSNVTDAGLTIDFTVAVPAGGSAVCMLRARAYSGEDVGKAEVTVTAPAGQRQAAGSHRLLTSKRAFHGEVIRCAPPGG